MAASLLPMAASAAAGVPPPLALEPPAEVLAKYETALERLPSPKYVRFEYAVEQAGPRNLAESHRIYRRGLTERDEILSVDGQTLPKPSIRIIRNHVNHYDVGVLAPRVRDYVFTYIGEHHEGMRVDYVFSTVPRATEAAFTVTGITIDGLHFLPRTIAYSSVAGNVHGRGTLTFWPQGNYWVVAAASANATIGGKLARERLTFHNYDFPESLPAETFVEPRPARPAVPLGAPAQG